jgi:tetratricopeptide (TPR) repeat protein
MLTLLIVGALLLCNAPGSSGKGADAVSNAEELISKGDLQGALRSLNIAGSEDPNNTRILYLQGYVLYRLRKLDDAQKKLEQVTQVAPPALRSRYFLGRIALLRGHPEKAIEWLKPAALSDPPVEDSLAQLGKAYLDAHQLADARDWTAKALKLSPWDGALHYRLARIYQQTGHFDLAAKEFQSSIGLKGADRDAVQKLVDCSRAISLGHRQEALELRDGLLKQSMLDPDVLVALGSSFASSGLPEDGLAAFQEAVRRDPTLFQAHFDIGLAYLKMGRPAEAVAPLEASLKIAPSSPDANSSLALAYVMLNRFSEAIHPLELVHKLLPASASIEGLLGVAYLRTGAGPKALPVIKAALEKQPGDPKLYFLLIECLNATEDQSGALAVTNEGIRRFPDLAKAHLAKAQQLARLGRYQEAGPSFARAAELDTNDIDPLLGLGEVQNKSGDYNDSITTYRRALQLDEANLTAQLGIARDLVALGKFSNAKEVLENASSMHADNQQIHIELSRVYARLGQRDLAAEQTRILQRLRSHESGRKDISR